jgi:predicted permease
MGAGRARLLRQLLTESFLLSILGGIGGLVLATWSSSLLSAFKPPGDTHVVLSFGVDVRVFLFTLGLSMLAGLVFGLAPAFRATRLDLVASLKKEAARDEGTERRFGLRNLLVVGQVAVTLILLVGASLLVRSLQSARSMDVGFELDRLAVMEIDLGLHNYSEASGKDFYQRVLERVQALPEVSSATLARRLPLTLNRHTEGIFIEGHQQSPDDLGYPVDYTRVGPGYFKTIGIPLLEGRDLNDSDTEDAPRVAVINETMAQMYWPEESPIGERFHLYAPTGPSVEIVGVCRDYNVRTVGEDPRPYMHFSTTQSYSAHNNLLVRTTADPAHAVATLRREILAMDPDILFFESTTLASLIEITLVPVRMGAGLIGGFGVLGMMLAGVGLYGVIAYSVSRRTHELGLRMALGATTTDVIRMVLKKGMTVVLVGVGLGLLGSALLSRLLVSVLYDVSPLDPLSFGAASLVLLVVAAVANYLPARRATLVEPVVALRYE